MPQSLNVLLVEDNPHDAELVLRELRRKDFEPDWRRVDNEADYLKQLDGDLDIILSDYQMPEFSGLRALELLKQRGSGVPFFLISGTIGEDVAVAAMREGASDYLLKDRLARLGSAVNHALTEHRGRKERKKNEEFLRLFRTLMDHSSDTLEIIDAETARFIDVNAKGPTELGCTRDEYLSMHVYEVDDTFTQSTWQLHAANVRAAGSLSGEGTHRRKNGTSFPIEFNAKWVTLDRDYIVSVTRDITQRKQAELALRTSEERFRQLAENIHEVFWIIDPTTEEMLYVSPAYERVWGRSCESLYASPKTWFDAVHGDDRARVAQAALIKQTTGNCDEEYRVLQPSGAVRWIRDRAFPVRGTGGHLQRIVGVAEDITERKKLQEQFLRAQRMETIGALAGGIAHDLNNVLAPILMSIPVLRSALKDPDALEMLRIIEMSVKRGASVVGRVLGFARGVEGKRILVDPKNLIREIKEITSDTLPKNIVVESSTPADLWMLLGDETQLHQVLLNLLVNARDAMAHGGTIRISAKNSLLDENYAAMVPEAKPGPYVMLAVSDTGTGIPREIREKIFEPFFTTKEIGKGTGLGLASSQAIVKSHDGFIQVESEVDQGTVFRIYLPAQPQATEQSTRTPADFPRGHGELVLVVDDEMAIREAMRKTLGGFGYRILVASNGAEAVGIYAQNRKSIAVVITDVLMPVMDGYATIVALRQIDPAVRIIAASGLSANAGLNHFLSKPYTAEAILKTLKEVLHPSEPAASAMI